MISNFGLIVLILISLICYYAFELPKKDKILFTLYKNRDELTLYAMNTPGMQDTEEYQYLIGLINVEIYLIKNNISFSDFYSSTVKSTVENERKIENLVEKIKSDHFMQKIYDDSFDVFANYFNKKFIWFKRLILHPMIFILNLIIKIMEVKNKHKLYDKITSVFSKTSNMSEIYDKYLKINKGIA